MPSKQTEEIVQEYAQLAKENKNIDVAALMVNALQQQDQNHVDPKWKRWAYIASLTLPPVGLLFAVYYFMKDESDARSAGVWCAVLTIVSLILSIVFFGMIINSSGVDLQQVQNITPQQIYEITQ